MLLLNTLGAFRRFASSTETNANELCTAESSLTRSLYQDLELQASPCQHPKLFPRKRHGHETSAGVNWWWWQRVHEEVSNKLFFIWLDFCLASNE
ncbi:hypothetical protein CBOM_08018 [Ceraceosorus bombacis]|uniref:Uncharacterized protein n=1 Tax=Ceraceosorus bombacis TaxID=401625 RepID=A0A0P1BAG5_9BASI|nr:hypothetical protein CBOM_08018 [Ceraceosorus bombacis]